MNFRPKEGEAISLEIDELSMIYRRVPSGRVVFSVPHDGMNPDDFAGIFGPRQQGVFERDVNVWPVVNEILAEFSACAVRGLAPRRYIDYNRSWPEGIRYGADDGFPPETALDDPRLERFYRAYHEYLDAFLTDSILRHGMKNCLLLDMHGFAVQPPYAPEGGYDVILGTGNRETIHWGDVDRELGDFLSGRGFSVFVPSEKDKGRPEDLYSADFITRSYSSRHGINAIQIELARRLRKRSEPEGRETFSRALADFLRMRMSG